MQVDAKTAQALEAIRRVGDRRFSKAAQRMCGQRRKYGRFDFGAIQNASLDFPDFSIDANTGRRAFDKKQIAAMPVHKSREPMVEAIGQSGVVCAGRFLVIQLPGDSIKIVRIIHNSTIGRTGGVCRKTARAVHKKIFRKSREAVPQKAQPLGAETPRGWRHFTV